MAALHWRLAPLTHTGDHGGGAPTVRGCDPCARGRPQGVAPTVRGYDPCARAARDRRGFTLVELLVALTIFVTVMASVTLVFNGAIRTSKQGFQNQEAYELARGTMKVLERDLSRAFTNRDHGDNFNFYGTPIGFTFVGLISADESSVPNMARVTYVIYHDPTLANLSGAFDQYTFESKEGPEVPTYQLLRYIEPGQDTLDSYPIDWSVPIVLDSGPSTTLESLARARVILAGCPTGDAGCDLLVRQAARREIWIKMLAGGGDVMPAETDDPPDGIIDGEFTVPDAWSFLGLGDPYDYVVGENIRFLSLASTDSYCAADLPALEIVLENNNLAIDFDDIIYEDGTQTCVRIVSSPDDAPIFYDPNPQFSDDPNPQFSTAAFSAVNGARPFFTYWDIGIIPNLPNTTADDQHTPVPFQFWNDWRNLLADGLDNDADSFVDETDERYGENSGSPLDTRLPIAVTTDFTLFFRSPYPGAPDFNERFTQRIDLPTAYRRTIKNTVPVTP